MDRKIELENALYIVSEYAFEHGEIIKAYVLIKSAPNLLEGSNRLSNLMERIMKRMEHIHLFQKHGRLGLAFIDPIDITDKEVYTKLLEELKKRPEIRTLVDVGCFTGWIGRNLSLHGYSVHGIDLMPDVLETAAFMATGTRATFEMLEGTKVGERHPKEFDAAVMFDVVEHVFDHNILLQSVENAVKDGGWIFINLPKLDNEADLEVVATDDREKEHLRTYTDPYKVFEKKKNLEISIVHNEIGQESWFIIYQC